MDSIYVCFSLKCFSSVDNVSFEADYSETYKPLLKFLYKNPKLPFSFSFNGPQLTYLSKKKSEVFSILKEMLERKQVEVFGGGFYNPILPLLNPADRNGQIDLLSTELRQKLGKRPRVITLYKDVWTPSLLTNFYSCDIDYVLLDEYIIPPQKQHFLPVFMSELGKGITIHYYSPTLNPVPNQPIEDFISKIVAAVSKVSKKDSFNNEPRIVNINLSHSEVKMLIASGWFEELTKNIELLNNSRIKFSRIVDYSEVSSQKIPAYISSGLGRETVRWIPNPFVEKNPSEKISYTIFDYLDTYPRSKALYNRMLYISLILNQFHGDKVIKNQAREKLWAAQNGLSLICSDRTIGSFTNSQQRQNSYRLLMDAEKIIRSASDFKESVLSFDYDSDGKNEYVCRMNNYFSYISLTSGAVRELEVLKNTGNYCDNLKRISEFDGADDGYIRGLFVDHIFSEEQFNSYVNGIIKGDGIFSKILYKEVKFSSKHREIQLKAEAICFGSQKISLLKKYIINSSGMNVQYIIKNESDKKFSAKFCVESNFADVNFSEKKKSCYKVNIATENAAKEFDTDKSSLSIYENGFEKNIGAIQINDADNGISFTFEPNENCSYCFYPIVFLRSNSDSNVQVGKTFVSTLFWDLEIESGKEIEKNINFSICDSHKKKKS